MNYSGCWNGWSFIPTSARSSQVLADCASCWAAKGRGKRGGLRVIYFWWLSDDKILLLDVYAKGKQEDLAADEIEKLKRKVIR